jgi:hypothetical protein
VSLAEVVGVSVGGVVGGVAGGGVVVAGVSVSSPLSFLQLVYRAADNNKRVRSFVNAVFILMF